MKPFGDAGPRSLLFEVLDLILAPLAVLWPLALAVSYAIGIAISDGPYDRELRDRVLAVVDDMARNAGDVKSLHQLATLHRIRNDATDRSYVQVLGPAGETLAGDDGLPAPHAGLCTDTDVRFREEAVADDELRIACQVAHLRDSTAPVIVQVAESTGRRRDHAAQVTLTVMGIVLVLVPITLILVGFGIHRGLGPIRRLKAGIEARSPSDLSPLPVGDAPTEVAPLLETLNVQLHRVRASIEAQKRFVADAAHQLKTPLAGLKTQAQLGRHAKSLEESEARLAGIAASADHLARLANQLLALARADEAGPFASSPVDLSRVLNVAGRDIADAAIGKSIRLDLDTPEAGPFVAGNPDLLHELFMNLLDNAVRYTPPGGRIEVRAYETEGGPVVEVEDDGPGIPEDERGLVFERFHRVLGTPSPGSGLGLPVVKSIAERHGATVGLDSGAQGRGALFIVRFPQGKP